MHTLTGKVAIVTGSSQGIGRGIARAFARAGALVTVVARTQEKVENVAKELGDLGERGLAVRCDVTRREDVIRAVRRTVDVHGGVDILVNNAHDVGGMDVERLFVDSDEQHLRRHFDSCLMGSYYFLQECYPHLRRRRGAVINMCSSAGVRGWPKYFSYAVAKEALRATTRVLAQEWGGDGIRVNAICPVAGDTPQFEQFAEALGPALEQMVQQLPLRRWGRSEEDLGAAAVFLASDSSSFITGQTMFVDGGMTIDAGH